MRLTHKELNKLCLQFKTDRLWSWSRVNCVHNSLYEYFLKYVARIKEDRDDSIYKVTGGITHDILEKFYNKEIKYEKMIELFNDGWMTAFDIADLKFNRSDNQKNESIADKYYYDLDHFFKTHKVIPHEVSLEEFVTVKIGDEYYQGYIDCNFIDDDGNHVILDWKTSTIYKGEKAQNESGQLCMYAMAFHQKGIPYEKIKIAWNFLKYVNVSEAQELKYNVSWETVKGESKTKEKLDKTKLISTIKASVKAWLKSYGCNKEEIDIHIARMEEINNIKDLPVEVQEHFNITKNTDKKPPRQIERCKIGESLYANVKAKMKKAGYDEDYVFSILEDFVRTNDMDCLPGDIKNLYEFSDCYVYVDLTEELIKHWEDYIIKTTKEIRAKEAEYNVTGDDTIWYESEDDVKNQSFYFSNLCGYSPSLHIPYKKYLQKLEAEKNDDIFGNSTSNKKDEYDEDDLSWLESL